MQVVGVRAIDRVPLVGKIAIAVIALGSVATVIVLVSNGTIEEQTGRNFFALFAILFGIGFVRDAFRGADGPRGVRSVTLKFVLLAFTLGLIVGGWTENWLLLTTSGILAGVLFSVIERYIGGGGGPNRAYRLAVWIPVGLAAMGEGVYIIAPL